MNWLSAVFMTLQCSEAAEEHSTVQPRVQGPCCGDVPCVSNVALLLGGSCTTS